MMTYSEEGSFCFVFEFDNKWIIAARAQVGQGTRIFGARWYIGVEVGMSLGQQ